MLVDVYVREWPFLHPRPDPSSTAHNGYMVRQFGIDFAGRDLGSVEHAEFVLWARENAGAARYVRTMLNDAQRDGLLSVNPASRVGLPQSASRREKDVPELEEVEGLLSLSWGLLRALIDLSAFAGPRQSEALALEWDDLDLDAGVAKVRRQRRRDGTTKKRAKGTEPGREIRLRSQTVALLGALERSDPRVFPLSHRQLRSQWEELRRAADVRVEWMQLRTHCASWLLDRGASPMDVALQLHGNTNPRTVLKYYSMLDKKLAQGRLAEVMG